MRFTAIPLLFLGLLPSLLTAQESQASQASQDSDNPLTVPACSTMLSIVLSCESKLGDAASVSGSVFSCLCFDNSGKYKPTVYDNAVAGCSSKYSDQSTDFDFWLPGFCTGSSYATDTGAAASTTGGGSAIGLTGVPTVATNTGTLSGLSSSPTANPGGLISSTTSNLISITPAPTSTSAGAGGHVSSTSSKAEGMKLEYISRDAMLLSIFGSILGAIFIL